jgi:hypothetical protein
MRWGGGTRRYRGRRSAVGAGGGGGCTLCHRLGVWAGSGKELGPTELGRI